MPKNSHHHRSSSVNSTKSRSTESTNKWKIPHYYRRSASGSTQASPDRNSSTGSCSTPVLPTMNVMSSPKKVLLEDPRDNHTKAKKSSRKKSGEMVFVNYTVQDTANENDTDLQTQPVSVPAPKAKLKKKSSKRRMLKIFGSSKNEHIEDIVEEQPMVLQMDSESKPLSGTPISESGIDASSLTTKRSYNSFLKHNRLNGKTPFSGNLSFPSLNMMGNTTDLPIDNNDFCSEKEVVPKSTHDPSLAKPPSRFTGSETNSTPNLSSIPLMNTKNTRLKYNKVAPQSSDRQKSQESGLYHSTESFNFKDQNYSNNKSSLSLNSDLSTPHFAKHSPDSPRTSRSFNCGDSQSKVKLPEENDASIAFSKMFTRKRANTGGSTCSLASPTIAQTIQQSNIKVNKLPTQRTTSVGSLSSMSNRYSPIRVASPGRARSATRGSSLYRLSRDLNSLPSVTDLPEMDSTTPVNEIFLDGQPQHKSGSVKGGHRKKQESISDAQRIQNSNSYITTPSSSLVTPPYYMTGYTLPSSASASSTPNVLETHNMNFVPSTSTVTSYRPSSNFSSFDKEYSNENDASGEFSAFNTPMENIPALKGIPRSTLEENEEEDVPVQDIPNTVHFQRRDIMGMDTHRKDDSLDFNSLMPHGSTTSSSIVDSVMTNSISTTTSNATGNYFQDQDKYTLVNTGLGLSDTNLDHFIRSQWKHASRSESNNNTGNRVSYSGSTPNNVDTTKTNLQVYTEFDFENPESFFHEQSKLLGEMGHSNNNSNSAINMNEPKSADTYIGNISPDTSATVSLGDLMGSNVSNNSERNFYDGHTFVPQYQANSSVENSNNQNAAPIANNDIDNNLQSFYFDNSN
ncbi:AGA_1a_G0016160.mRNA.1.CDS.1 [Saccharomyces cerevisiae]|nr:Bck2p [Saccharomyces cerevisiae YJM1250]AJU49032.1 Bck2p [Saccharomyces cerevisiae YJM1381]CAI4439786.1 AGA_1a_G0016160.mRNA.1.CDS.1 [Saccharomyces cerevisiae]CAI6636054.1 AGA_1a_G0016160.mRNA.1.CDS.1 [Saccharomyces cerevisiae]